MNSGHFLAVSSEAYSDSDGSVAVLSHFTDRSDVSVYNGKDKIHKRIAFGGNQGKIKSVLCVRLEAACSFHIELNTARLIPVIESDRYFIGRTGKSACLHGLPRFGVFYTLDRNFADRHRAGKLEFRPTVGACVA